MAIEKTEFRRVLGHFAAGVTVVTTKTAEGRPVGLTATAFSSVSLVPPLVLVCIDKKAESFLHFEVCGAFAVNFLHVEQQDLSQRFAVSGGDKFIGLSYRTSSTGCPILSDTIGYLDCRVVHRYEGGDHIIYVGEVEAADAFEGGPLLHFRGRYGKVEAE